ncbi:hypothetical protein E8E12_010134 [Didymella heteroderae]|uniref:MACPF domain-containing protein n=1 Tax=Didymella heteroderae TaxID=1769908 RepID=A0A9P4WYE6_9PLEO|nr:hypothetical protein E8E12_010134 [Didymella heteroderae]
MATVDVLTIRSLGLEPTDSHWSSIIAALRAAGFTTTATNAFQAGFTANWRNRCSTIIIRTSSTHGDQIGARLELDAPLMAARQTSSSTVFYRAFTGMANVAQDDPSGEPPASPILPFNCQGLFGGIDATQSFSKGQGIRPNLFELLNLDAKEYLHQDVQWQGQGSLSGADDHIATFSIPRYLDFVWETRFHEETVTGETKKEFQTNLTTSMGLDASVDGFGMEMNNSFNENDYSETWNKYASLYRHHQIYTLKINQSAPTKLHQYLTEHAMDTFDNGTAAEIIDTFGTHFMTKAVFGGLKRWSSTLDIRNHEVSKSLGISLGIKVAETAPVSEDGKEGTEGTKAPDSGGANISNQSETTKKIYKSLQITTTDILGGTPRSNNDEWMTSIYRNPAVINFSLRNIADLILDPVKAADVQKEADRRMQEAGVRVNHKAQIMFNSFAGVEDDHGSGAQMDISCARLNRIDGWFNIGHYATGSLGWNTDNYQGLMIRDIPDAKVQLIVRPTGVFRTWGMRSPHRLGLFGLQGPPGYISLSDAFFREEGVGVDRFEDQGMIHEQELTVEASWGSKLWDDSHTGSNDVGSAWAVDVGPFDDAKSKILKVPDNSSPGFLFKSFSTQDTPGGKPRKLDLSKCKLLKNSFL